MREIANHDAEQLLCEWQVKATPLIVSLFADNGDYGSVMAVGGWCKVASVGASVRICGADNDTPFNACFPLNAPECRYSTGLEADAELMRALPMAEPIYAPEVRMLGMVWPHMGRRVYLQEYGEGEKKGEVQRCR